MNGRDATRIESLKRKSNSKVDRITLVRTRKCKKHRFNIDKNIDAREIERKQATKVSNYFARVDNCVDDYKQESRKGIEIIEWIARVKWNCIYIFEQFNNIAILENNKRRIYGSWKLLLLLRLYFSLTACNTLVIPTFSVYLSKKWLSRWKW